MFLFLSTKSIKQLPLKSLNDALCNEFWVTVLYEVLKAAESHGVFHNSSEDEISLITLDYFTT